MSDWSSCAEHRVYLAGIGPDGAAEFVCRCFVCARCGQHTGNSTQGHTWSLCRVDGVNKEFHFCCPGDCELAGG